MESRERLLDAMAEATQAHADYLAQRITFRTYTRAMDHLVICRDACGASFVRVVRLPERAALAGGV